MLRVSILTTLIPYFQCTCVLYIIFIRRDNGLYQALEVLASDATDNLS